MSRYGYESCHCPLKHPFVFNLRRLILVVVSEKCKEFIVSYPLVLLPYALCFGVRVSLSPQ